VLVVEDVVLSTCGAMFAPGQERTAAELSRVCHPSAEHQAELFATFYGPAHRALATLGACRGADLKADLLTAVRRFDVSDDDTLVLRMDYLEAVISKPATP
jgi:hypothetical protein